MMKTKVKYGTDTGKLYVYDTRTLKWRHRNTACFTKSTCTCKSLKFFFIIYQMLHILKLGITLSPLSLCMEGVSKIKFHALIVKHYFNFILCLKIKVMPLNSVRTDYYFLHNENHSLLSIN